MYGGLGNAGSAAASLALPLVALAFGGAHGWRWAVAFGAVVVLVLCYLVTFGGELAVVSILPQLFAEAYGLGVAAAALALTLTLREPAGEAKEALPLAAG